MTTIQLDPDALEAAVAAHYRYCGYVNDTEHMRRIVTAYIAAIEPKMREVRDRVKRMDMHCPHNDESGNPSEWLAGLHYGLQRSLPELDALFALFGLEAE